MLKLKELRQTATVAWSPSSSQPMLAVGAAAGALDSSFSMSAELQLFSLDLESKTLEMNKEASIATPSRFSRIAWSQNVVACGMENGNLDLWNSQKLLSDPSNALLTRNENTHKGSVNALDFNPLQPNLLASGASDADIYIWDMTNPTAPFFPGNKSPKLADVSCVAWNRQVAHILATCSPNGCTVIWDLKNKREVTSLVNGAGRQRCTAVAWNPEVATQLITSSEDDLNPGLLVWDLRHARAPERVLNGHAAGVLGLSWCPQDPGLLLSCGKDSRTILWDPSSGYAMGEITPASNWVFDVQWNPKIPGLISTCSFDNSVSVHSLLGGKNESQQNMNQNDPFSQSSHAQTLTLQLSRPPKWLHRPMGATFGYGSKLVSFSARSVTAENHPVITLRSVETDSVFVQQALVFEEAVQSGRLTSHCQEKQTTNEPMREIWQFLEALTSSGDQKALLALLRGDTREEESKPSEENKETQDPTEEKQETEDESEGKKDIFGSSVVSDFDSLKLDQGEPFELNLESDSTDGAITKAIVLGDFSRAADLCLKAERYADALLVAQCSGPELVAEVQQKYLQLTSKPSYLHLLSALLKNDLDQALSQAVLSSSWRPLLAFICSFSTNGEQSFFTLCSKLASRLEEEGLSDAAGLCWLCAGHVEKTVPWLLSKTSADAKETNSLQTFIEMVTVLGTISDVASAKIEVLAKKYERYAALLAAQGQVELAAKYEALQSQQLEQEQEENQSKFTQPTKQRQPRPQETQWPQTQQQPTYQQQETYQPVYNPVLTQPTPVTPAVYNPYPPNTPSYNPNPYGAPPIAPEANTGSPSPLPAVERDVGNWNDAPVVQSRKMKSNPGGAKSINPILPPTQQQPPASAPPMEGFFKPKQAEVPVQPPPQTTHHHHHHQQTNTPPVMNTFNPPPPNPNPPPSTNMMPGGPMSTPMAASTPATVPARSLQKPKSAPAPTKPKKVSGDKSKIPSQYMPIVKILSHSIAQCQMVSPANKRELGMIKKKLEGGFDRLNDGEIKPDAIKDLLELVRYVEMRDYGSALDLHIQLVTHYPEESSWLASAKQLITILARLGV
eukprot:Lithocolla_globosa_v1_NODE_281_length_4678_cov_13.661043.p1 type:complete len:1073 gc:universal NODE_281_length_4678_cov_13.661043:1186-4404(+)